MIFKKNSIKFLSLIVVIFTSLWWWKIITTNLALAILLLLLTTLLLYLFLISSSLKIQTAVILLYLSILAIIIFNQGYDETISSRSALDIQSYNKRHEYLAKELKKTYTNRVVLYFYKNLYFPAEVLQANFFSNLDINLYFFASHPRERTGFTEFEKYSFLTLPLFIIGIIYFLLQKTYSFLVLLLTVSLVSSFISQKFYLGPILFFPILNLVITTGLSIVAVKAIKYLKHAKH